MPLNKQSVQIPFAMGLDTKTDPNQVSLGKFLVLQNSVFTKGQLLTKRNGYGFLPTLPDTTNNLLSTFKDNLVATGLNLFELSPEAGQWYKKGYLNQVFLSVNPVVRSTTSQSSVDLAITSNNFSCVVWNDSDTNNYYQIIDTNSGNIVIFEGTLESGSSQPRVFLLGSNFVITYLISVLGTVHLRFISIPTLNPTSASSPRDISTLVASTTAAYDAVIFSSSMYIAWNGSDGGGAIRVSWLDSNLILHFTDIFAGENASLLSATADSTSNVIWFSYINSSGALKALAVNTILGTVLAPTTIVAGPINSTEMTSTATGMVLTVFYQNTNTYSYSSVRSDFLSKVTLTQAGSAGSPANIVRSVGLGSKAFIFGSDTYMLAAYNGKFQPSYFLINSSGQVVSKLAYGNGGGYTASQVLSGATVYGNNVFIGYLFKDLAVALNKTQNQTTGGIYSQLGINIAEFTFNQVPQSLEIASCLLFSGGLVKMHDGVMPVELNFNLWPEDLGFSIAATGGGLKSQQYFYQAVYEWTDSQGILHRSAPSIALKVDSTNTSGTVLSFTGNTTTGSNQITSVSSTVGLHVGQVITDFTTPGNLGPNTTITAIVGSTLTITPAALGNSGGDVFHTVDVISNTVQVPTLRLTYKTGRNNVRIVLYRWSVSQQTFYQVTSLTAPTVNSVTTDSVTIVDNLNDAEIIGNTLLYTTGGVVENIGPPATNAMTLFKARVFMVDSEDANQDWFSKQVIQDTPVEMSDTFIQYLAPTLGASGNQGFITAQYSMDDKLIAFKKDVPYYLTGNGPDNTGANNDFSEFIAITSTIGCNNQNSLAIMPNGIMFQSDKGIWLLGRDLSTTYIGAPVEGFNSQTVLSSVTPPATNQVRFTLSGTTLMYDYFYNQWGEFTGIPSISSTIFQGLHTFMNSSGQVLQETIGKYQDGVEPVNRNLTTAWVSLAGLQGFERAYYFFLLANFISPHRISVGIAYDYDPSIVQVSVIKPDNFSPVYGTDPLYGDSTPYGGPSQVEQWKVYLQRQKCQTFQITITEMFDPTFGTLPGAGFTMSGIDLVVGTKKPYPKPVPARSVG